MCGLVGPARTLAGNGQRSQIELTAVVEDERLHVAVRDTSPALPTQRSHDDYATTGRGLGLVAALSVAHGVEGLGDDGWLAAREHHDALLRELVLLPGWPGGAAAGIGDQAAADEARMAVGSALDAAVQHARERGAAVVPLPQYHSGALPSVPQALDLVVPVGREQAASFAELQAVLDHGERLAAAGQLLVRGGLPQIIAVRDWAADQVIAQVTEAPPAPWPGADDERCTADLDRQAVPAG